MKLKRGSYSYLIGFLILLIESIFSIVALIFAYLNYSSDPNPLLSEYGSRMSGNFVAIILFTLFTVWTVICPPAILLNGLKHNSLDRPLRAVSVELFLFAAAVTLTTALYMPKSMPWYLVTLRFLKGLPIALLGVCIMLMLKNKRRFKTASLILCVICAATSFMGFDFQNIFFFSSYADRRNVNNYVSMLLFAVAMCLFFVGLYFCIDGCAKAEKKKKAPAKERESAAALDDMEALESGADMRMKHE